MLTQIISGKNLGEGFRNLVLMQVLPALTGMEQQEEEDVPTAIMKHSALPIAGQR